MQINFNGELVSLEKPLVMGILNITEDSFYDGGRYLEETAMLKRAEQMLTEGADIIDVGAVSTRPGAADISENIEIERITRSVKSLRAHFPAIRLSIDTWRASVARAAIQNGAQMINDISGGTFDPDMIPLIGELQVPYCLMHCPEKPDVMQQHIHYENLIADMLQFFGRQLSLLYEFHVHDIIIDPGFGFGKTLEQNYILLNNLSAFHQLGLPLLVGVSRKSMIYKLLDCTPEDALNGTTVVNTVALLNGADILRVHDVKAAVEAVKLIESVKCNNRIGDDTSKNSLIS